MIAGKQVTVYQNIGSGGSFEICYVTGEFPITQSDLMASGKTGAPNRLKDTYYFNEKLDRLNISKSLMVSFNLSSVLTDTPIYETISEHSVLNPVQRDDLRKIGPGFIENLQLKPGNELYRQIDSLAMGSPIWPIVSDISMAILEATKKKLAVDYLTFYTTYVDDTFDIWDNMGHSSKI